MGIALASPRGEDGKGGQLSPTRPWTGSWDSRKIRWEVWTHSGGGPVGDEYGKDWKSLTWLFPENSITNVIIYERNKRGNMHSRAWF